MGWWHCVRTESDGYGQADDRGIREDVEAEGDACVYYCVDLREGWMWKLREELAIVTSTHATKAATIPGNERSA